jgi:mannose-6-phosphate isomerase-like protein (cupin superfamily)/GNAT superfamily N-acetyltransferase
VERRAAQPPDAVALRAVRPTDLPALDALALAAKASQGYAPAQLGVWAADLRTAPDSLDHHPAWLLEQAGTVLGFCQLDPQGSPWRLVSLFVAPGWQRQGLGSRLLRHAAQRASAAGERFLAVDADPRADGFYRARGGWRIGAIAAPIPAEPARVRPQLLLPVDEADGCRAVGAGRTDAPSGEAIAPATATLAAAQTVTAPDGSMVHPLLRASRGSLARFALAPGQVSRAVAHRRVEELWYVLEGEGWMWRRQGESASVVALAPGTALSIPVGTAFQFRAAAHAPLVAIGLTMPPWPGDDEALAVEGCWPTTA